MKQELECVESCDPDTTSFSEMSSVLWKPLPMCPIFQFRFVFLCCVATVLFPCLLSAAEQNDEFRHYFVGRWNAESLSGSSFTTTVVNDFVRFDLELKDAKPQDWEEIPSGPRLIDPEKVASNNVDGVLIVLTPSCIAGECYCLEISCTGQLQSYRRTPDGRVNSWDGGQVVIQAKQRGDGYQIICDVPALPLKKAQVFDRARTSYLLGTIFQFDGRDGTAHIFSWKLAQSWKPNPFAPSALGNLLSNESAEIRSKTQEETVVINRLLDSERVLRNQVSEFLVNRQVIKRAQEWMENSDQYPEVDRWEVFTKRDNVLRDVEPNGADQDGVMNGRSGQSFVDQEWSLCLQQAKNLVDALPLRLASKDGQESIEIIHKASRLLLVLRSKGALKSVSLIALGHDTEIQNLVIVFRGSSYDDGFDAYLDGKYEKPQGLSLESFEYDDARLSILPLAFDGAHQSESNHWRIQSKQNFHQVTLYNQAMTGVEVKSLDPGAVRLTWDELSGEEKLAWTEHFARRVDREGGYLFESLRHYAFSATSRKGREK